MGFIHIIYAIVVIYLYDLDKMKIHIHVKYVLKDVDYKQIIVEKICLNIIYLCVIVYILGCTYYV